MVFFLESTLPPLLGTAVDLALPTIRPRRRTWAEDPFPDQPGSPVMLSPPALKNYLEPMSPTTSGEPKLTEFPRGG